MQGEWAPEQSSHLAGPFRHDTKQSPTLGKPEPTFVRGRTGPFVKGTVEAGPSVSSTLVCGERRRCLLPFGRTSQMARGDSTATGRKAWPRWPTWDRATVNLAPAGELSLTLTLSTVPFLSFAWDSSVEIGALLFTLPFPFI